MLFHVRAYVADFLRYFADRLAPASQTMLTAQDVQRMIESAIQEQYTLLIRSVHEVTARRMQGEKVTYAD